MLIKDRVVVEDILYNAIGGVKRIMKKSNPFP